MPVAMARKMYGWYDPSKVEDGMMPKSAGKLPHHEVNEDGSPGAANLAGVRNALSRLPQSDIPDAEVEAVRAHLRAHLGDQPEDHAHPEIDLVFDPAVFRDAVGRAQELPFDPVVFRDAMASLAHDAPAPPSAPPRPVDLGPTPSVPEIEPEPPPDPWSTIAAAVGLAANDAPAPPQPKTEDPAPEPGFFMDADAFRTALRRATL
jgi:hypothetical protein